MYDTVFQLLARGLNLPPSWAMPTAVPTRFEPSELRKKLFWAEDEDGQAQLVRYYHGILCAHPWALLEIGGHLTQYGGSAVFKPQIESMTLNIYRSVMTGRLELLWRPSPSIKSLTAELIFDTTVKLTLGGIAYPVQLQPELNGRRELVLPQVMGARLSIGMPDTPSTHALYLRPTDFDLSETLADIGQSQTRVLADADVLGAYLNAPLNTDKIALALVAMHRVESFHI